MIVLGPTGRNFAAGMSGGIAYVLDADNRFEKHCNLGMVDIVPLDDDAARVVHDLVRRHYDYTQSAVAWRVLSGWKELLHKFRKVFPTEYQQVLKKQHLDSDAAKLASI